MGMMTQSLEDYLEAIYMCVVAGRPAQVSDVAHQLNVKMPSVVKAIRGSASSRRSRMRRSS